MPDRGDVVVVSFPDASGPKRRPAIVISSPEYHKAHPDVVVALITSRVERATTTTDYLIGDWRTAGLRKPSAVRTYIATVLKDDAQVIGSLAENDLKGALEAIRVGLGF